MHHITDKLHRHSKANAEHTPVSNLSAVPQTTTTTTTTTTGSNPVLLEKNYAANTQGVYIPNQTTQTTYVQQPLQSTFTSQQTFASQQSVQTNASYSQVETVNVHTLPTVVQTRVRPAIVEQTTRIETVTEIQPIVHREIESTQHHILEQHIYESVRSAGPSVITNQAIVEETVRPRILEQIQPILHRNVAAPYVERVEEHITEHVVQPTVTTKQVQSETRALSIEEATSRGYVSAPAPVVASVPVVHTTTAQTLTEQRTRAAIVEQTVRPEKITQVQPIIHREIDAPEVHLIEKHTYESVRSSGPGVITNQAIVQETIRPHIVEDIQNIVHRSVAAPFIERVEQHTNERVVAPTTTTKQVTSERTIAAPVQISQQREIGAPTIQHMEAPASFESRSRAAIVEQTVRPEKITQVQPIIHREIDAPEVHLIEKHSFETVRSSGPGVITNQAIVQETIRPHIVEDIQNIVHRSVAAPFIERVEQHTNERVVAPTTTTKQVTSERTIAAPVQISQQREIGAPTVQHMEAPASFESRSRAAIVEQTVRPEKITQVQPIIHREIDAPEVHVIEQHSYERVRSTGPSTITNQAIVQETVRPHIVEDIQNIVHRSVPAPFVERVEQHTNERVVAPTTTTKQVTSERTTAAPVQISHQKEIGAPIIQHTEAAATMESRSRAAIVEQTVRPEKITQVQPIIHREIEAPEVHLIEQHSYERVPSSGPGVITNQAIVQETIRPHVVEDIQNIVHRSVPAPFVERVEQHTNERVVAPTTTTKQVTSERTIAAPVQISHQKEIGAPIIQHAEAAATIENRTRSAIVEQTVRPEKITQVQPIIHREIDAPEVHLIEQHSYERVRSSGPGVITNQAIVQETVRPHIVEDIQNIVHRSVPAPFVERVEQHTNERVVAPTTTTKQVTSERTTAAPVQISQQKPIGAPIIQHAEAAATIENRTRSAIVEQTVRPEKITQVQPIIHREIDAPEVHLIEQHSFERVRSTGPSTITNQAIVQETIRPHVVEDIQNIVHRSVPAPFVERVEQHTNERVVAPTTTTKQVTSERTTAAPVQISQQKPIGAPIIQHAEAAATLESRSRAAIVEQTSRPEKITQVQPIVHREIEAPEVHLIERHTYERVPSSGPSTITRGAIVEETIRPTVIEEIQPIIHRNVAQTFVEHVEQHTTEHVVAPTTTTTQVTSERRTVAAAPLPALVQQRSTTPVVHSSTAAAVTESVTRPALVEQTSRAERIVEVQPIIHREIDAPEVHLIEQHTYEKVPSAGNSVVTKQTIVEETIRPHVIEEIQPVVHRNIPQTFVERVEQHTTEHLVAPTTTTKQVLVEKHAHVLAPAAAAAPAPFVAAGGAPLTATATAPVVVEQQKKHGFFNRH